MEGPLKASSFDLPAVGSRRQIAALLERGGAACRPTMRIMQSCCVFTSLTGIANTPDICR
jgi:hypothetical protein